MKANVADIAVMGVLPPGRMTSLRHILSLCCDHYGVPAEDIYSHRRDAEVATARQAVMFLAKETTRLTLPRIGRFLDRDRTTVRDGIKSFREKLERGDVDLPMKVEVLRREILAIESRSDTPEAMTDALQAAIAQMCQKLVGLLERDPLRGIRLLAELLEKADG